LPDLAVTDCTVNIISNVWKWFADQVAVIVAIGGTPAAPPAKAATATIPIVFSNGGDPVKLGLVPRLNRPGGNVTGVSFMVSELGAKRLELLRELVPTAKSIGFLVNPPNPNASADTTEIQEAGRTLGLQMHIQSASSEREIDAAFAAFAQQPVNAVMVAAERTSGADVINSLHWQRSMYCRPRTRYVSMLSRGD
jgi:putative ABC transport system substrate-binding protein